MHRHPEDNPGPRVSPLDRIKEYLMDHRLSPRVRARLDNATGDFILEDDDGMVRVNNYEAAVAIIERTWL